MDYWVSKKGRKGAGDSFLKKYYSKNIPKT